MTDAVTAFLGNVVPSFRRKLPVPLLSGSEEDVDVANERGRIEGQATANEDILVLEGLTKVRLCKTCNVFFVNEVSSAVFSQSVCLSVFTV